MNDKTEERRDRRRERHCKLVFTCFILCVFVYGTASSLGDYTGTDIIKKTSHLRIRMVIFYILLIIYKSHEKTKTNKGLILHGRIVCVAKAFI